MEFVKVANKKDIGQGMALCAEVNGKKIAIYNVKGRFYALNNKCTHMGGPLCKGSLEGNIVTCPWHGSKFDVTTGEVVGGPAKMNEEIIEVRVSGEDIEVKV
jgi:nitrite reductase/ring-hydroxylating ferredoxin subunit